MYKFSKLEIMSIMLISIHSFGINIMILLKKIVSQKIFNRLNDMTNIKSKSQMEQMIEKDIVRVAIYNKMAYWVLDNVVYRAGIDEDGNVLENEAQTIDVFKLSEKEVNNLLTILDSIKK